MAAVFIAGNSIAAAGVSLISNQTLSRRPLICTLGPHRLFITGKTCEWNLDIFRRENMAGIRSHKHGKPIFVVQVHEQALQTIHKEFEVSQGDKGVVP